MPLFAFSSSRKKVSTPRWFAGISITSNCHRIESAMIGVHGQGSGAPVEIRKTISFDLPREIIDCYNELWTSVYTNFPGDRFSHQAPADIRVPSSLFTHLLRELASVEEEAIEELIGESRLARSDVLAVGVHDPGLRSMTRHGMFYASLCDAPYLAEQTGLNIVDAFSMQDVASGGRGGPVFALPTWIFLKSEIQDRILLDIGRTATLTFLPRADSPFSHQRIQHLDIIPCGSLLDAMTWNLTDGKSSVDVGGRLAVQGCQVPVLLSDLRLAASQPEEWNPFGLSPEPYLKAASRAAKTDHAYQDVLCTASCFIGETIVENILTMIAEHSPHVDSEPEILLGGGCRMHGMLMNVLTSQLQKRSLLPMSQFDIPAETFDALCAAMLTLRCVDHIPASLPHLTGSETTKPLGRITPGGILNWHRLLQEMAGTKPAGRTLRSAM